MLRTKVENHPIILRSLSKIRRQELEIAGTYYTTRSSTMIIARMSIRRISDEPSNTTTTRANPPGESSVVLSAWNVSTLQYPGKNPQPQSAATNAQKQIAAADRIFPGPGQFPAMAILLPYRTIMHSLLPKLSVHAARIRPAHYEPNDPFLLFKGIGAIVFIDLVIGSSCPSGPFIENHVRVPAPSWG